MDDHVEVLIRVPAALHERLARLAAAEFRDPAGQAAWLVHEGVDRAEHRVTARAPSLRERRQAFEDLAVKLRDLRLAAGQPSTRAIAEGAPGIRSHATVADVLAGRRATSWATVAAMVAYLGGSPADYRAEWAATR